MSSDYGSASIIAFFLIVKALRNGVVSFKFVQGGPAGQYDHGMFQTGRWCSKGSEGWTEYVDVSSHGH